MTWYALQCPTCGRWRSADVKQMRKYVMKCFRCHTQTKIHQESRGGLFINHHKLPNSMAARWKAASLNAQGAHHANI